ncbi:MAG: NAD(P)H-hydrate epimerase, partial [Myxococcota bacterium]
MDDHRPGRAAIANPSYLNCSLRHGTPIFTRAQAQAFDDSAISAGVSGLVLMENAGRGAADVLEQDCSDFLCRPVILGGPGKNGGDAWVVARHLRVRGYVPFCILVGESEHLQGDALANWNALEAMQIPRLQIPCPHLSRQSSFDEATSELKRASILVDGLFGTGLARPIDGTFRHLIEQSNRLGIPTLSLDCPSGIDCDTGQVWGTAFHASVTVTFGALKRGLLQHPGAAHAGRIRVLDIGVPSPANADSCVRIEATQVAQNLPCRAKDSHKGSAGRVAVLGGSAGKTGAAYLSGLGALRGGAGLVTLVGIEDVARRWEAKVVELMTESVGAEFSVDAALRCIDGMDAVVLGPGLGISKSTTGFVRQLSKEASMPMVLDADALTALAKEKCLDELADHPGPRVLTPHPGEAA